MSNEVQTILELARRVKKLKEKAADHSQLTMAELTKLDELYSSVEMLLARDEFKDKQLISAFFGQSNLHEEIAEAAFYSHRSNVLEQVFSKRANNLEEVFQKANVWVQHLPNGFSKTSDGFAEEYLVWSIYLDLQHLNSNTACSEDLMQLAE